MLGRSTDNWQRYAETIQTECSKKRERSVNQHRVSRDNRYGVVGSTPRMWTDWVAASASLRVMSGCRPMDGWTRDRSWFGGVGPPTGPLVWLEGGFSGGTLPCLWGSTAHGSGGFCPSSIQTQRSSLLWELCSDRFKCHKIFLRQVPGRYSMLVGTRWEVQLIDGTTPGLHQHRESSVETRIRSMAIRPWIKVQWSKR